MLTKRLPWYVLMLLGCSASPDGGGADAPPGSTSSAGGTAGAVTGGAGGAVAGAGGALGGASAGSGGSSVAGAGPTACGALPAISLMNPAPAAQVSSGAVSLEANTANAAPVSGMAVTFYLRPKHDPDFTIAIMPDTQNYVVDPWNQQHFDKQTSWIMENRVRDNIVGVIHNGDIINKPEVMEQWDWAEKAMETLEQPQPEYPAGLPYIVAIGNHDQQPMSAVGTADEFNRRFGVARFDGRPYYGGHFGERNDYSYIKFSAGSQKFLVIALENGPVPADAQAWALEVVRAHPDHRVILDVHELIDSSGAWSGPGESIYTLMRAEKNVELMTCGHHLGESRRSDTFEGHTIHTQFANWQHLDQGGMGRMRLWHFSPKDGTLLVRTYSPSFDEEFTADSSRFTLPFDMSTAAPEFTPVAVMNDTAGAATATTGALDPATEYEWFVETTDACGQRAQSEVRSFSTL